VWSCDRECAPSIICVMCGCRSRLILTAKVLTVESRPPHSSLPRCVCVQCIILVNLQGSLVVRVLIRDSFVASLTPRPGVALGKLLTPVCHQAV